jgi:hypothetical protein
MALEYAATTRQLGGVLPSLKAPSGALNSQDVTALEEAVRTCRRFVPGMGRTIDWAEVSLKVGRPAGFCQEYYHRVRQNRLRAGRYTEQEEEAIMGVYEKYGADADRLCAALPSRHRRSLISKLKRLLAQKACK